MLENLLSLVKENADSAIINNSAIPNDRNDEAVETATHSIFDTLKGSVQSGNLSDVMQLFNNGDGNVSSLPLTQNIQGNFTGNLMQKFGLSSAQASGIASSLIPMVLSKFVRKTNDPNDNSFDLSSILGSLGGNNFDMGSVLSKFGLGSNNQGGNDLTDTLKNMFGK